MDGSESARMVYLVLLLTVVGGYFLVENRRRMGKVMQQAAIWGLIFIGVVAAVGLWDDITRQVAPRAEIQGDGRITIPVAPDGHYYVRAAANGQMLTFVIDTGATDIVLTAADAARIGINMETLVYRGRAQTANGAVRTADVMLDSLKLGGVTDRHVTAVVNAGDLDTSLLGMSYLSRYRITLDGKVMTLVR